MSKPTPETIEMLKAQFPDRVLLEVEAVDGDDQVMTFVMTGPNKDEYDFYIEKMLAAKDLKGESERIKAVRKAAENAALAQIRWPDRPSVQRAFEMRPEMIDGFPEELRKAAGSNVELRARKL